MQLRRDITAAVLRTMNRSTKYDRRLVRVLLLSTVALAAFEIGKRM